MNLKQLLIAITLLLTMLLATSFANTQPYQSPDFQAAYQDYLAVSDDQGGSAKRLAKSWQQLVDENPNDPLALVLLGSSHTLMGRDAMMPWSKMSHTEKGLDEMAMALRLLKTEHRQQEFQALSVDLQVKSTAAITFTQVPAMFGRHEEGFYIFADILNDPSFQKLPAERVSYIYYFAIAAAKHLEKTDHMIQWQQQLKSLSVNDDYSQAALALES